MSLRTEVEGLRDHSQRQGTWGIEYGDDWFARDVLRVIDAHVCLPSPEALAEALHDDAGCGKGNDLHGLAECRYVAVFGRHADAILARLRERP